MKLRLCAHEVTIYLKGGDRIVAHATELTKKYSGNELTGLSWKGGKDMPFYARLDDISAISLRRVFNWRNYFLAPK